MLRQHDEEPLLENHQENRRNSSLAIIKMLENKKNFNKLDADLKERIILFENSKKNKGYIYAGASLLGIASMGGFATFLANFLRLPNLKEANALGKVELLRYINTAIESINRTCGEVFPMPGNICEPSIFNSEEANLCFSNGYTTFLSQRNTTDIVNWLIQSYNENCPSMENFCAWQQHVDLATECTARMAQYNSLSCDDGHLAGLYVNYNELYKACGSIPAYNCSTYFSPAIQCLSRAIDICNFLITPDAAHTLFFNTTILNHNYTCADKFYTPEALSTCAREAYDCNDYGVDEFWLTTFRIIILIVSIIGLLVILGSSLFTMIKATSWFNETDRFTDLNEENQKSFDELLTSYDIQCDIDRTELKVTEAMDEVDKVRLKLSKNEKMLTDNYITAMIFNDPESLLSNIPNDVALRFVRFAAAIIADCKNQISLRDEYMTLLQGCNDPGSGLSAFSKDETKIIISRINQYQIGLFANQRLNIDMTSEDCEKFTLENFKRTKPK